MTASSNFLATSSVTPRLNYQTWNELVAWQVVFITKPTTRASRFQVRVT